MDRGTRAGVIRPRARGIDRTRPAHGLVAARFRRYEARSGMPLLHDHLLLSVKAQREDGTWGSVHTEVLFEHTIACSALYDEVVMTEACEALVLRLARLDVTVHGSLPTTVRAAGALLPAAPTTRS
ncbi:relaxase domain-containing protein [Streptomyces sp. NPDC059862]|uniref:relaxase domain-containing protein n=1 Tax=Streptomyces sp. NPDC059862 TaxID=3346975 RepID=UPI003665C2CB